MIPDKDRLLRHVDDLEHGVITRAAINDLRGVITRLDEMDDLVDAVCSCRTQEIPVLRMRPPQDDLGGRP